MTDREIIKALGELAKITPTPYLFDVCKGAATRIIELNKDLEFARKQNQMIGSLINERKSNAL